MLHHWPKSAPVAANRKCEASNLQLSCQMKIDNNGFQKNDQETQILLANSMVSVYNDRLQSMTTWKLIDVRTAG
jgi:hypothetical protein